MTKKKDIKSKALNKRDSYSPRMLKTYRDNVIPNMVSRFKYENSMQVPKLLSIALNMGIGDAKTNSKKLESAIKEIKMITGQKPVGCKVTLRSSKMYEFFERLVCIALPRSRDFRGLSFKSFDGRGNYNFGVKEQIIFAEINYDDIDSVRGLNITLSTSANTDEEAYWLLKEFGFPLREKPVKKQIDEVA